MPARNGAWNRSRSAAVAVFQRSARIGGEYTWVVSSELRDAGPAFLLQNRTVELRVPQNLHHLALSVIIYAGEAKCRQSLPSGALVLHKPTPSSDAHEITPLRRRRHRHSRPPRTSASPALSLRCTLHRKSRIGYRDRPSPEIYYKVPKGQISWRNIFRDTDSQTTLTGRGFLRFPTPRAEARWSRWSSGKL